MRVTRHMNACRACESGQMTVELAVMVPVVIVVALTVANLAHYVELCAQFDRIAPDMVLAHGVAGEGGAARSASAADVLGAIRESMGDEGGLGSIEIGVDVGSVSREPPAGSGITFPVSPLLREFTCTLTYRPWPGSFVIAGMVYHSPLALSHARVVVVDCFRPGVVV